MFFVLCLCFFTGPILMVSCNPLPQCPLCQNVQSSNCDLYQPANTAHDCPTPYQNDMNRNFVNELLSNPTIQMILDPNTKLINQDGNEVPRHPQNSNQQAVVNNYIIIPPEVFVNGTKGSKKSAQTGRKRSKNDTNHGIVTVNNSGDIKDINKTNQNNTDAIKTLSQAILQAVSEKSEINDGNTINNKRRRNKKRPKNNRVSNEGSNLNVKRSRNETSDSISINNDKNLNNSLIQNYIYDYSDNVKRSNYEYYELAMKKYTTSTSKPNKNDTTKNEMTNNNENNDFIADNQTNDASIANNTKSNNTEITKSNYVNKTGNIISKEIPVNVINTDPKEDEIVKDLHKKYPEIPENLLHSLLSNLKDQLNNEKSNNSNGNRATRKTKARRKGNNNKRRINSTNSRKRKNGKNKNGINNRNSANSEPNKNNIKTETYNMSNTNHNIAGPIIYRPASNDPNTIDNTSKFLRNFLEKLVNKSRAETKPANETNLDSINDLNKTNDIQNETLIDISNDNQKVEEIVIDSPDEVESSVQSLEKQMDNSYKEVTTENTNVEEYHDLIFKSNTNPIKEEIVTDSPDVVDSSVQSSEKQSDNYNKAIVTEKTKVEENSDLILKTSSDEVLNFIETSTLLPIKPKVHLGEFGANTFPPLGDEDVVPIMELNDIIDEYYPDFTKDAIAYLESNEELNVNHKVPDFSSRHYYTTDKNYELNEYYSKKTHSNDQNEAINNHVQISKINDYEETAPRPLSKDESGSEELNFKSPPLLDSPDFETRAINKNAYKRDGINDFNKVSSYSDIKAAQFNYNEKPNVKSNTDKNIETLYAKSKVVKYGQSTKLSHDYLDDIFDGVDDTSLVFATHYED